MGVRSLCHIEYIFSFVILEIEIRRQGWRSWFDSRLDAAYVCAYAHHLKTIEIDFGFGGT
jgi:hypothetical protein